MVKLLYQLILLLVLAVEWDLIEREIGIVSQAPVIIITTVVVIGLMVASSTWWLAKNIFSGRIETLQTDKTSLEERLRVKSEDLKKLQTEKEHLESRLLLSGQGLENQKKEFEEKSKAERLTIYQLRILELIDLLEKNNPTQPNQFPFECSVDEVVGRLQLEYAQVNSTFRKLKEMGFVESLWEGQATFLATNQPINEEKPVRLTPEGKEYLKHYLEESAP